MQQKVLTLLCTNFCPCMLVKCLDPHSVVVASRMWWRFPRTLFFCRGNGCCPKQSSLGNAQLKKHCNLTSVNGTNGAQLQGLRNLIFFYLHYRSEVLFWGLAMHLRALVEPGELMTARRQLSGVGSLVQLARRGLLLRPPAQDNWIAPIWWGNLKKILGIVIDINVPFCFLQRVFSS